MCNWLFTQHRFAVFAPLTLFQTLFALAVFADVEPSSQIAERVGQKTSELFNQLVVSDFAAERDFFTEQLREMASVDKWTEARNHIIRETGPTPVFTGHKLTFYQREHLLAAVDFIGDPAKAETYICGFVLWQIDTPETMQLARIEQNIVELQFFKSMPIETAVQILISWHCPHDFIEHELGVSLQSE